MAVRYLQSHTVICKDLSRFGRNYYEAGMYLDKYFVERNIRFIAIQDNVDSAKAARQTRARQGMFLGSKAPYHSLPPPAPDSAPSDSVLPE